MAGPSYRRRCFAAACSTFRKGSRHRPGLSMCRSPSGWSTFLRPRTIVELGAHTGVSFSAMCQSVQSLQLATSCYAVDTWKGDDRSGLYAEDVYRNFAEFASISITARFRGLFARHSMRRFGTLMTAPSICFTSMACTPMRRCATIMNSGFPSFPQTLLFYFMTRKSGIVLSVSLDFWNEISRDRSHFNFLHGHGLGAGACSPSPRSSCSGSAGADPCTCDVVRGVSLV